MKKIAFFSIVAGLFVTGCTVKTTPYQNKINGSTMEFQKISEYKTGTSCIKQGGGTGTYGSNSIADAARAGNIKKVEYAEHVVHDNFGSRQFCTTVYGK
ncbi:MAG: TRL-like family protein [Campylobacterales bacterium]|nr:TRL-like family protein [Campylobacterales bacterium]